MKLILILASIAWAQAGKLDRDYLPPKGRSSAGHDNFHQTPHRSSNEAIPQKPSNSPVVDITYAQKTYSSSEARPERTQAARERNAAVLRQDNLNEGEIYSYAYETENGIFAEVRGVATKGVRTQGSYSYTGDDGKVYSVRYTADENGFVPQGDHLPTPHPIPEAILKALEQNARDEAAGIFDDGSYNEVKYSDKSQQQYYNTNARPVEDNSFLIELIILLAAVALAKAGKLDRVYLPPNARASAGSGNFLQTPNLSSSEAHAQNAYSSSPVSNTNYAQSAYSGYEGRLERAQAALERNAAILRQDNSNDGETYSYAYETENGIYAEESGVATNGVQAQGGYTYTGDDGKVYSVRYTADENGFIPQGDHLPTSPPIPEEILKALEQNARDEAAGIYDDGSYAEAKYAGNNQQQYYNTNAQPINYNTNSAAVQKTYLPPSAQRDTQRLGY